ncbi:MAG: 23S rRNA (pseudouridine(1915)-N(3))-methyltransferase RlmH [Lentisphaeria bacterium]|nr:23S rRNA (pseudouridine(1915)-N(3))-methyltransferase RlmH [Lentisphaeria bacterium]MBO5764702.1 23S rRNA (pseudouridine(1915)-N(3))-methyltransferase RlmH [Lentisphaeria bacterium]MBO5992119.1 23S rRNA (pseudouridine(1915)-N(3))-methyltransferase RlmH [Lentisphaeria bacterium]MBO7154097.1 23S rRNA (pseudouridine(1915)-N(3))-methyltransferase RlmH [Lentisphaeria bacterium]MBR2632595.1 23S rRNA (pseudouridine(1915)-N(3))-methyltransferase RlmH [Lentisphaeria bacterium]
MLMKLILVGKLKDKMILSKCEEYLKRLRHYGKLEVVELADSGIESEGKAILKELERDRVRDFIVLTEEGKEYSSVQLSNRLVSSDKKLVFLIGGPYGIAPEVKAAADTLWSLSKLTFPHEIARLLLCEQLFRAMNIANGGAYHHE